MSGDGTFSLVEPLTERENDVLALLAQGKSNRQIADALVLSLNTVKWYNRQIYGKLGVANREEAVARARAMGLLPQELDHTRRPRALPAPATRLLGRETELKEIQALLTGGEARLVSIVGPGGMGKTRLALEVAYKLAASFAGGVAFAGLAPLQSAEGIVPALADALRFKFAAGPGETQDEQQQLLDYLQEKKLLLVLDNLEHLLDGLTLLSEILANAPDVKMLVTSRERLKLQAEHVYTLQGLVLSDWETVEEAQRDPAVELFLQYGERVRPDYDLQVEDLGPLRHIMETVQGMPLAIILAAPWLELMEPAEIAEEIERSLDFLEADFRDLPRRQRSVRAVFETTWARLSEREKSVFAALSVFRGGFSLEAAREVAGARPRELLALAGRSLLVRQDAGRFEVHELLRQFAAGQLANWRTHQNDVRNRHSAHYLALLGKSELALKGAKAETALEALAVDIENIYVGWDWAVSRQDFTRLNAGAFSLATFYLRFGRYEEGRLAFQQAIEQLRHHVSETSIVDGPKILTLARLLALQCSLLGAKGDIVEATAIGEEALALLENPALQTGDNRREKALALASLGWVYVGRDQTAKAQVLLQESISLSDSAGDSWQAACTSFYLGGVALKQAKFDLAEHHHRRAVQLFEGLGDRRWRALAQMALGFGLSCLGKWEEAEKGLRESIEIFLELDDPGSGSMAAALLSEILCYGGRFEEARELAMGSIKALERFGMKNWLLISQSQWCRAILHLGNYEAVLSRIPNMLHDAHAMRATMSVGVIQLLSGCAYLARERQHKAIDQLEEAARGFEEIGAADYLCHALFVLCCAYAITGDVSAARIALRQLPAIALEQKMSEVAAGILAAASLLECVRGETEQSVELYTLACRYQFVANSRWWEEVVGRRIKAEAAKLPTEKMAAASARGEAADLWETAGDLLQALQC